MVRKSARHERKKPSEDYRRGREEGIAEARKELVEGTASLYVWGRRDIGQCLDRSTGLPLIAIAGCIIDDGILGRTDGHNEHIKAHIAQHGLPKSSRKPFERDLFDLAGYVSRHEDELFEFEIDGPVVNSLDDRIRVRGFRAVEKGKRSPFVTLEVSSTYDDPADANARWKPIKCFLPMSVRSTLQFVLGPSGSDTLVVRGKTSTRDQLALVLISLRGETAWLRLEHMLRPSSG